MNKSSVFEIGCILRAKTREELIKEVWTGRFEANLSDAHVEMLKSYERAVSSFPGFFFGHLDEFGEERYPTYIQQPNEHLYTVPYGYSPLLLLEEKFSKYGQVLCKTLFDEKIAWLAENKLVKL